MDIKTILLVVAILILLYLITRKERMEDMNDNCKWNDGDVIYNPENKECNCSWVDNSGKIYNPEMHTCLMCYECKNLKTGNITIRSKCIKAGPNKEEKGKLISVYDNRESCNL